MKTLFDLLVKKRLTPNQLFLMYSCKAGVDYGHFIPSAKIEYGKLIDMGFLDRISMTLTPSGESLLQEIEKLTQPTKKTKALTTEWNDEIEQYRMIFPSGHGSGKAFRSPVRELVPRFEWFFKNHQFSWEVVLEATKRYVEAKKDDLTFMRTSAYFIRKEDSSKVAISDLAHWCEMVQQELDDPDSIKPTMDFTGLYRVF